MAFINTCNPMNFQYNVGIGTEIPSGSLHIYCSTYDASIRLTDAGVTGADWSLIASSGGGTPIFRLYNRYTAATNMTWTCGGKVGIGTTSPIGDVKTDIRSSCPLTAAVGQPIFLGSDDSTGPLGIVVQHLCGHGVCRADITSTRYGLSGNDLSLNIDSSDPNTAGGLYIKYRGNVGIGTSSPDTRLHIRNCVNGGTNNFLLTLQNTCTVADARAGIAFLDNSNTAGSGGVSGASIQVANNGIDGTGHLLFSSLLNGAVTERMRITSGGGVVIGGTVASNVGLTIYGSNAATIYQTANTGTGSGNGFYVGHTGDVSYVWNYNNYPTVFATNNTERMRITSGGNVGVGTTSPTSLLTLAPPANGVCSTIEFNSGDNAVISSYYSQVFAVDNSNTQAGRSFTFTKGNKGYANQCKTIMIIDADSGNVVIGPSASSILDNVRLQICDANAAGTDDMVRLMQCLPGNHAFYRAQRCGGATLIMGPTRNSGDGCIPSESAIIWTTTNNPIIIGTCNRERIRFATNGNVGIGCPSPGATLTVGGSIHSTDTIKTTSGTVNAVLSWTATTGVVGTETNHALQFRTGDTERVRIDTSGNVGIGTTSPTQRLSVDGNVGVAGYNWKLQSDTDGNWGFGLCNCGTTYYTYLTYAADATADRRGGIFNVAGNNWIAYGNCTNNFIVTNCVGVATTTPTYRLHVNGTFYAAGSSIKYKEGICHYDTNSCLFMCLKPVTYQYKDEFKHLGKELKSDIQIGLIAEDVAEVMPELAVLVNEEDEKVVRNVDYEKLSIVLLAEVQKLRREVDTLKNN